MNVIENILVHGYSLECQNWVPVTLKLNSDGIVKYNEHI